MFLLHTFGLFHRLKYPLTFNSGVIMRTLRLVSPLLVVILQPELKFLRKCRSGSWTRNQMWVSFLLDFAANELLLLPDTVAQSVEHPSLGPGFRCNSTVGSNHERDMSSLSLTLQHEVVGNFIEKILATPSVGERRNKCKLLWDKKNILLILSILSFSSAAQPSSHFNEEISCLPPH